MASLKPVLLAHTGHRLQVEASELSDPDGLKAWVARHTQIPAQEIIFLNIQGKGIRPQTIHAEKEILVFDRRISQGTSPNTLSSFSLECPTPKKYSVSPAPNSIDDSRSLASWQLLFKSRRDWALHIVDDCANMAKIIQARYDETDVILKCLDAALANVDSFVKTTESKYYELKKWTDPAQKDCNTLVSQWEIYLEIARQVPISPTLARFMTGRDARKSRQTTLEDLVDSETTRKTVNLAPTALRLFNNKIADLDRGADKMFNNCDQLFQKFDKIVERSVMQHKNDWQQLLEDIEAVAGKVDTDYQATLQFVNPSKDVSQASKTAANHTKQFLPSIQNRALEMDEMVQYATQKRNETAADSLAMMLKIAQTTDLMTGVKGQVNLIHQGGEEMDTFDYLRLIQQLPYMYASFATEGIRRREWADKIKADSSTLANEMALFQDEELKRRRKWQKSVGSTYGPDRSETHVLGLEVNLLGEDEQWPAVARQDLDDFLDLIRRQGAESQITDEVAKLLGELDAPTKQQSKRVKAFKNGSVHEAGLGRSGLMIRGDDDVLRTLQDEKTRVESKLKTAESRVRRLEGLLHQQSQASRPSIGNIFQPQSNDSMASIKGGRPSDDRRHSSTSEASEALQNRINKLEGELNAEKERSAVLEQEATARTTDMQGRMDEVNSTKKDLLGNMEALKNEFIEERKSLEEEIKTLKARLEETEDEIEHFGESRENEKVTYDTKVQTLEEDVERLTEEKREDTLKAQGQLEFLRNENKVQRERSVSLERQLQEARETIRSLSKRAEVSEESAETHATSLRDVHAQLAPREYAPQDFADLIESVATKSIAAATRVQSLEQDLSLAKADLELAQATAKDVKTELSATVEKLSSEELAAVHLRETLDKDRARCSALEAEVNDGRQQLNQLRLQMTEGETGSEALRKNLGQEEKKVAELSEQLASRQSRVGSLEEEIRMSREKLQSTESRYAALSSRFEDRNRRSKDLTQRLYTQNERLSRLLERLNYSITRQEGGRMVFQKIPRSERTSQNPNDSSDPGTSIRRSTTNVLADSTDLKLLYWMNAEDSHAEEDQYEAYMAGPGNFDIDAFSEAIYRRIKEIEHSARKLNRDSKAYRERAHNLAKESHDKIAFKSFKEGDLALFLPTRNQTTGAWAAFNVGCPHFFLREQEGHRLRSREWLVARITRVQERVVDLSKSLQSTAAAPSETETDSMNTGDEFDNPFDLSDGLRWWLIDAHEDKPGAPSTPGLGKSTVAANTVAATADMHAHRAARQKSKLGPHGGIEGVSKTLSKSLESRRSSSGSKKALPFALGGPAKGSALASETNSMRAAAADSPGGSASPALEHSIAGPSGVQNETAIQPVADSAGDDADSEQQDATAAKSGRDSDQEAAVQPLSHNADDAGNPKRPADLSRRRSGQTQAQPNPPLQRNVSAASTVDSPSKKSVVWDSLWNVEVNYPGR